jgi:deazaflavin-dependent oxidoreductase (nitroreductase family)
VVEGFDVGASPREFADGARARTLVLTTTNGTRTILTAAERCETVLLGSLLNLTAVAREARRAGGDVAILCSGFKGAFALDDAYCAGRLVAALGGERTDAAIGAETIAAAWPTPLDGLTARTYGPPGLEADIEFCAQLDLLDTVPRFAGRVGSAAEVVAWSATAGTRRPGETSSSTRQVRGSEGENVSEAETLFGQEHVRRYRETDGGVGHIWKRGSKILLLTTSGRKTGRQTTVPLIYEHDGDRYVIVASKGGAPRHPGWYLNLAKHPKVEVQVEGDVFGARARTAEGAERERLWKLAARQWPDYDEYAKRTDREIPVVVLERV